MLGMARASLRYWTFGEESTGQRGRIRCAWTGRPDGLLAGDCWWGGWVVMSTGAGWVQAHEQQSPMSRERGRAADVGRRTVDGSGTGDIGGRRSCNESLILAQDQRWRRALRMQVARELRL